MAAGNFGSDVVVAAAEILDEGVTGGEDPRRAVALQSAHRPESGFQPFVVLEQVAAIEEAALIYPAIGGRPRPAVCPANSLATSPGSTSSSAWHAGHPGVRSQAKTSFSASLASGNPYPGITGKSG
jgi:hypothetical protein